MPQMTQKQNNEIATATEHGTAIYKVGGVAALLHLVSTLVTIMVVAILGGEPKTATVCVLG